MNEVCEFMTNDFSGCDKSNHCVARKVMLLILPGSSFYKFISKQYHLIGDRRIRCILCLILQASSGSGQVSKYLTFILLWRWLLIECFKEHVQSLFNFIIKLVALSEGFFKVLLKLCKFFFTPILGSPLLNAKVKALFLGTRAPGFNKW